MKKSIIVLTFIFLMCNIQAQEEQKKDTKNMTNVELKQYYNKKGKNQIGVGWALLGGGILINTISIISVTHNFDYNIEAGLTIGTASMIGSIPLFILGSKNKNRANLLLQDSNIPISLERSRNIHLKSVGIGIPICK